MYLMQIFKDFKLTPQAFDERYKAAERLVKIDFSDIWEDPDPEAIAFRDVLLGFYVGVFNGLCDLAYRSLITNYSIDKRREFMSTLKGLWDYQELHDLRPTFEPGAVCRHNIPLTNERPKCDCSPYDKVVYCVHSLRIDVRCRLCERPGEPYA